MTDEINTAPEITEQNEDDIGDLKYYIISGIIAFIFVKWLWAYMGW